MSTTLSIHPISQLIRKRRTTYASNYISKEIPKELIEEIITNALWAPTHKKTQPWRFIGLSGKHQEVFGQYMMEYYKERLSEEQYPPSRYQSTIEYPKNATMIAIIFQRSQRVEIAEWEEIAAISCAVQNMWLSCTALNIGCYWDTCDAAIEYGNALDLKEHERCLGIFYMGYIQEESQEKRKRSTLKRKLVWDIK
ncbi:nitroreductase [Aquimarina hainanensis]|uniref:Nitroreductase n=1 Tax=Aquimarina hainanensis TaxID=1578017 RepID=A0ABW5N845_9FLAO|nr:nitroreductase [Aquimarina sp. TRL1]QKX03686.1 nitroreductase [Aquimarina sp. TRL1]